MPAGSFHGGFYGASQNAFYGASDGLTHQLDGTTAGASGASAALSVAHPLAAVAAGASTASAALTVARPLAALSAGTGTATGLLLVEHALIGASAGTSTVTGSTIIIPALLGITGGTAGAVGDLVVAHRLVGISSSDSTATAVVSVSLPVDGSSAGVSGAGATLFNIRPLAGSIAGTSTAAVTDVLVAHALVGSAAGTATVAGGAIVAHVLAGSTAGAATASSDLVVAHPLAGSTAGAAGAAATVTNSQYFTTRIDGTSGVVGALSVAHPLAARADGVSGVVGDASVAHPLAGSSAGSSSVSTPDLAVSHALAGSTSDVSTVTGNVVIGKTLAASSAGRSTASATIVSTPSDNILNPRVDVVTNSWTTDTGATTNLWQAIDEDVASDTDYVQSPTGPTAANYYEVALQTKTDPLSSTGHIAHYRYQKTGTGTMDLTVGLYQGGTLITSWAHTNIGSSWVTQDQTLSGVIADTITNYDDLRLRFVPNQTASEREAPDAILLQTNLVGAVTDIDEDPDAPGADWLTATSVTVASILRVSFPTPSVTPATGAGLQEFRAWVRKTSASGTPTATLELWESGVLKSTLLSATNITSTTGQLISATWDASTLTTATGANVELRITGTVGGSGGNRATIEVGAVEWNTSFPTGKAQVSWANLEIPVAGVTYELDGSSNGAGSAAGDLSATLALAAVTNGTTTAAADLAVAHPLVPTATAGASGAVADLSVHHPLAGVITDVSTVAGGLRVAHPLDAVSTGTSTVAGDLRVAHPLAASSTGTSTAGANLTSVAHSLAAVSAGASTAGADLLVTHPLAGSTAGTSTAAAASRVTYVLAGSSAGVSADNVAILVGHLLRGASDSVSTISGTINVAHTLVGSSAGASTATASTKVTFVLTGQIDGATSASAASAVRWVLHGFTRGVAGTIGVLQDAITLVGIPSEEGIGRPAVGVGSIQPAGIPSTEGVGVPTLRSATDWWSSAHLYRRKIDVASVGIEMLPAGHGVELLVPAFQEQGKARSDLADLEVIFVADGQWHRLARAVTKVNGGLLVRFLLAEPILAAGLGRYYLYYGAPNDTGSGRPAFVDNPWPIKVMSDSPMIDYVRLGENWSDGRSSVPGAVATFRFSGTAVRFFGEKGPGGGVAQMKLDNEPPVKIDYYTPEVSIEELHRWENLGDYAHKLQLRVVGHPNVNSFSRMINVMSFEYVAPVTVIDLEEEVLVGAWTALVMTPVGG